MIRTNKIFNKTAKNNISFQVAHSKIQAPLLSSCPSWIILMVSGLLFIQTNPLNAMETPDISLRRKSTRGQAKAPNTEFYQDALHPLTQDFLKDKDLSMRLKKIQSYILDAKEKISNHQINKIDFNEIDLKEILKCLECNSELEKILQNVLHHELEIDSYELRPINGGRSGNKVSIASCNGQDFLAIKTFQDKEKGLQELLHSLVALALNPRPKQLKMARIYDAVFCAKDGLSIIMEAAKGQEIHQFLSTNSSKHVIDACAVYLAAFHIGNYCKNVNNIDGKQFIKHASEPYHTLHLNLLTSEEKEDIDLLNLSIGMRVLETDEKVTSSNIIKLLGTVKEQILFKKLVKISCDTFEKNCGYIFRIEKPYPRTRTHGDAQKDNFLYNSTDDLKDANGSEIRKDSFHRVTMIDFESIGKTIGKIGDPAEDVGRFVGSLWDLAVRSNNLEFANYTTISMLQKQFIETYLHQIRNSDVFSSEEDKKSFKSIFDENCNFYTLRFYRAVFNTEKDKAIKKKILESWIKETIELQSSSQEKPKKIIARKKSGDREWLSVCTDQEKIIHLIPEQLDVFIESAAEGSNKTYLTQLWESLQQLGIATLAGMGGVGKTSLALEYAHEAVTENAYDLIYWLPCGSELSLLQGYRKLLREIGVSIDRGSSITHVDSRRIIELVKKHVPERGKCLLIYDNVPNADFLKDKTPQNIHIIGISRCIQGWERPPLILKVFPAEDSIKYLLKLTDVNKENPEYIEIKKEAGELAKELGCFPLALAHAAHYLKLVGGKNMTLEHFKDYLKGFQTLTTDYFEKKKDSFTNEKSEITYQNLIGRTFRMSEKYLIDNGIFELAKKLINYCSYLDSDYIPEEIFLEYWPDTTENKEKIKRVLEKLTALSLIKKIEGESLFSIHQLVQLVVREEKELGKNQQSQEVLTSLASIFNELFKKNVYTADNIDKMINNLPHILQILERLSLLKVFSKEVDQLEWIGKILYVIGKDSISEFERQNISHTSSSLPYKNENLLQIVNKTKFFLQKRVIDDSVPCWLEKIAETSHHTIQAALGGIYFLGLSVNEEHTKALYWCTKAAAKLNAFAENILGEMYISSSAVDKNYNDAFKWFSLAAQQGRAHAQYRLGQMYLKGLGIEPDIDAAIILYNLAADQEFAVLHFEL
ncbi:MAG: SEL1-like repeat protein [Alphaproteobacteria bacterium]|nr:SEL1-like repeat protein [Alphaproteobacteria bacterium]